VRLHLTGALPSKVRHAGREPLAARTDQFVQISVTHPTSPVAESERGPRRPVTGRDCA
jgi:hypothetical protein